MALFIQSEKSVKLDVTNLSVDERILIEKLWALVEKHGIDLNSACTGVLPSPDFGYFALASRYWRASLCIYFAGFIKGFVEAGAGFLEPWLFNIRHSIELYLKGCLMYVTWYYEIHQDFLKSGDKTQVEKIQHEHNLNKLYAEYKKKLEHVLNSWDTEEVCDKPELEKLILTKRGEEILVEVSEADSTGFRFRYPSLIKQRGKKENVHELQKMSWQWNEEELFPLTGLPKTPEVAFTHVKVMNSMHDLIKELSDIKSQHDALYSYLSDIQDIAFEEFHQDF